MRSGLRVLAVMLAGFFHLSAPLSAHHGVAAYDPSKLITVKGVVTDYEFMNPHVLIYVDAKDDAGGIQTWEAELNSANMLTRSGWGRTTIKIGDEITLIGFRAKSELLSLRPKVVLGPDGKELPEVGTGTLDGGWHC